MNSTTTSSSSLSLWESGRLASRSVRAGRRDAVERWIVVALLALSAMLLAAFVDVVQQDVQHSQFARARQQEAAVASASCAGFESDARLDAAPPTDCRSTPAAVDDDDQAAR